MTAQSTSSVVAASSASPAAVPVPERTPAPAPPSPSPSSADAPPREDAPCLGVHPCLLAFLLLYASLTFIFALSTSQPLSLTLLHLVLSIFPAVLIARVVLTNIRPPSPPLRRLLDTLLFSAFPLSIAITVAELLLLALLAALILSPSTIRAAIQAIPQSTPDSPVNVSAALRSTVPMWRVVLLAVVNAYAVAAFVEESAKFLLARAMLRRHVPAAPPLAADARSAVAVAVFAALGMATVENVAYMFNLDMPTPENVEKSPWFVEIVQLVLRDLLAFPVHIGCTVVTVAAYLNGRPAAGLAASVAFHGSFDALPLTIAALQWYDIAKAPWIDTAVVAVQTVSVVAFATVVWSRARRLIARDGLIGSGEQLQAPEVRADELHTLDNAGKNDMV